MSGQNESQMLFEAKQKREKKEKKEKKESGLRNKIGSIFDHKHKDSTPTQNAGGSNSTQMQNKPAALLPPTLPPKSENQIASKLQQPTKSRSSEGSSLKQSEDLYNQIADYDKARKKFVDDAKPLLDEKNRMMEIMFDDFLRRLGALIAKNGIESKVQEAMISEERKRFDKIKGQLFDAQPSTKIIEREIKARKNVLDLEKACVLVQSTWKANKARRAYLLLQKNTKHRNKIVQEVLETEKVYVANITALVEAYLRPLKASPQILSSQETSIIFSNIELILGINKELKENLEKRINTWSRTQTIGDIFLRLAPFFKMYVQYVNNYNLALSTLTEVKKDRFPFIDFLERARQREDVAKYGMNPLENLLIMPVQRVPRYELLLKDLVKFTDNDHPDFKNLCDALFKVKDVAAKINDSKRVAENMNTTVRIQGSLGLDNLVQPHRRFVMEGDVTYADPSMSASPDRRSFKKRDTAMFLSNFTAVMGEKPVHLFLFNDILIVSHVKSSLSNNLVHNGAVLKHKRTIQLEDLALEPSHVPKSFNLNFEKGRQQLTFTCAKEEDKNKWIDAITKAINEFVSHRQSLKLEPTPDQQKDKLLSMFPAVPEPAFGPSSAIPSGPVFTPLGSSTSSSSLSTPKKNIKLSDLLGIFEKVFDVQKQLFALPVELETLIPQYTQTASHARMTQVYDRIQALRKSTDEMLAYNDAIVSTFKNEKLAVELSTMIRDGQDKVYDMTKWIGSNTNGSDPNSKIPRTLMAYLMDWYFNVLSKWENIIDENI